MCMFVWKKIMTKETLYHQVTHLLNETKTSKHMEALQALRLINDPKDFISETVIDCACSNWAASLTIIVALILPLSTAFQPNFYFWSFLSGSRSNQQILPSDWKDSYKLWLLYLFWPYVKVCHVYHVVLCVHSQSYSTFQ